MKRLPHEMIRASAGTGKTHELAIRYLSLLAQGARPEQILAATFARKAAGEIVERILLRLADAIADPDRLAQLQQWLGPGAPDRSGCLEILKHLTRRLHRLRIGTLDSFFAQVAMHYSLEMGLPPGWRIVDESQDASLRTEAIQAVIESEGSAKLRTLLHMLGKGEITRSVTDQIRQVAHSLYEFYCQTDVAAWQGPARRQELRADELADALGQFANLSGVPAGKMTDAHADDVQRAGKQNWEAFLNTGLAKAVGCGKTLFARKEIPPDVVSAYGPLTRHATAVLTNRLANQNQATWELLDKFATAYRELKLQRRALRFEDVTQAVGRGLAQGQIDEMSYRLDAQTAHLLLDEFQDTSLPQWNVLRPIASRVTAQTGRSLFCVGDVKQAIYGWRGGVSEIFDLVEEDLAGLEQRALTQSYRSSQPVIDAVNKVFLSLGDSPALEEYLDVADAWRRHFQQHSTARIELAGYVRMACAPRAIEGQKQREVTLAHAAARVAQLAHQYPGRSVGVLVRKNDAVARLIFELRTRHQTPASEEGGNPLTDSPAVQVILSVLKLADHPGDNVSAFHVATSPLGPVLELPWPAAPADTERTALAARRMLLAKGYGRAIYDWSQQLAAACDERERQRLSQLVGLAQAYEPQATGRTTDFVDFVTVRKVEDPTSAQVRVMTVHQAKGLQFDIVVAPELDVPFKGRTPALVVDRKRAVDPIVRVSRYANALLQGLLPEDYRQMFETWPRQDAQESLCVLYVAMTRAVHHLELIVAPPKENEKNLPKTWAGLLRSTLAPEGKLGPETVAYEHGDAAWGGESVNLPTETPPAPLPERLGLLPAHGARRHLDRRSPSRLTDRGWDLSALLGERSGPEAARGTLWHAWLEQVEWLDAGEPADATLWQVAQPLATPGLDIAKELADFRELLQKPAIRQTLSRPTVAELARRLGAKAAAGGEALEPRLWRERAFAVRDDDALLAGAIDRLVVWYMAGRPVAAEIVDFKTGSRGEGDLAAAVDRYRPQMGAYRRAVAELLGLTPAEIRVKLLFVDRAESRDV